jgi:hypothetical protein
MTFYLSFRIALSLKERHEKGYNIAAMPFNRW